MRKAADLKGMSSCATMEPTTPFCPWRLLNLSPTSGRRVCRINVCAHRHPPHTLMPMNFASITHHVNLDHAHSPPQTGTHAFPRLGGYSGVYSGVQRAVFKGAVVDCCGRMIEERARALMTMWPSSLLVMSTLSTMQDSPGGPFQDTGAGLNADDCGFTGPWGKGSLVDIGTCSCKL